MTTITSYAEADAYLKAGKRSKTDRPAPTGSSTRIVRELVAPETISVVYHRTPVVTYHADGRVFVWANGYFTRTTVDRLNTYTALAGWFRVHKADNHGQGEALAFDSPVGSWPRTPERVQRCRTCKGTGQTTWTSYATVTSEPEVRYSQCYRCSGTGRVDYGNNAVPEILHGVIEITRLLATAAPTPRHLTDWSDWSSTYLRTSYEGEPVYACRCKLCLSGASSWQDYAWNHAY